MTFDTLLGYAHWSIPNQRISTYTLQKLVRYLETEAWERGLTFYFQGAP